MSEENVECFSKEISRTEEHQEQAKIQTLDLPNEKEEVEMEVVACESLIEKKLDVTAIPVAMELVESLIKKEGLEEINSSVMSIDENPLNYNGGTIVPVVPTTEELQERVKSEILDLSVVPNEKEEAGMEWVETLSLMEKKLDVNGYTVIDKTLLMDNRGTVVEPLNASKKMPRTEDYEDHLKTENSNLSVVPSPEKRKRKKKEKEIGSGEMTIDENPFNYNGGTIVKEVNSKRSSLVGKLKIRPFSSLAEPVQSTPLLIRANLLENSNQSVPLAPDNQIFPHSHEMNASTQAEFNEGTNIDGFTNTPVEKNLGTTWDNHSNMSSSLSSPRLVQSTLQDSKNLENATISSATDCRVIKVEESVQTTSIDAPFIHSYYSTSTNTIVKTELDLGVTTGANLEQSNDSMKNPDSNVLTSDSILDVDQQILDPYHDVDPNDLLKYKKSLKKGLYVCKFCDYQRNEFRDIERHSGKLHSEKYNYRCFICATIAYHRKSRIGPDMTYEHRSLRALEFHVATYHRGKKLFMCPTCDRLFKTEVTLKNHRGTAHKEQLFECRLCSYKCETVSILEKHWSVHSATMVECPMCKKMISQLKMEKHFYSHSRKTMKPSDPPEKFTCKVCGLTGSVSTMRKHYKNRHHNGELRCQFCNYCVNSKHRLEKHLKLHRFYECTFPSCGKTFNLERTYKSHYRLHTAKGKIYSCPAEECDFQTLTAYQLVLHKKKTKHHFRFKCPHCPERCRIEEALKSHMQNEHGGNESLKQEDDQGSDSADQIAHFSRGWLGISYLGSSYSEDWQSTADPLPEYENRQSTANPLPESEDGQSTASALPESEDGQTTADPLPESEDGQSTADPLPESEDGQSTADPLPESEDGQSTADPAPESENEQSTASALPESEDGQSTANPVPESEDGLSAANPLPESEDRQSTADPLPESDDGLSTANPPPESEDRQSTANPVPESEDGLSAANPLPESEDRQSTADPLPESDDGLSAANPPPESEDRQSMANPLPESEDALSAANPLPESEVGQSTANPLPENLSDDSESFFSIPEI